MTARTRRPHCIEILLQPDEDFQEVIDAYKAELAALGHSLSTVDGIHMHRCKQCGASFRFYQTMHNARGGKVVYSDFVDEHLQCDRRFMCLHPEEPV